MTYTPDPISKIKIEYVINQTTRRERSMIDSIVNEMSRQPLSLSSRFVRLQIGLLQSQDSHCVPFS